MRTQSTIYERVFIFGMMTNDSVGFLLPMYFWIQRSMSNIFKSVLWVLTQFLQTFGDCLWFEDILTYFGSYQQMDSIPYIWLM